MDKNFEIKLRAIEPTDLELLYIWENDKEIWKVSNTITPFSREVLKRYIDNSHLDIYETKQLRLMIDLKEKEEDNHIRTIGSADIFDFDPYHNRAGIGILIATKADRGKGYASVALDQIIEYSFNILLLHQLYCNITEDNKISMTLFQNHGFKMVGCKKQWIKTSEKYMDEYMLQLINNKQIIP